MHANCQGLRGGDLPEPFQALLNGFPVDILHGEPVHPAGFAGRMHLNEVWVGEGGGGNGLVVEAGHIFGIRRQRRLERLKRDGPPQGGLPAFVDRSHAALPKFF